MSDGPTTTDTAAPEGSRDDVKACVRYGFCVAVCPTYTVLNTEQDSPRGRIALIKEMMESGGSPTASTVNHLDQCLSCSACMRPCAAGVNYRRIIDDARAHIEANYRRPLGERLQRAIVLHGFTRPQLSRALLRIASAMPGPIVNWVPARLRLFIETAKRLRPEWTPTVDTPQLSARAAAGKAMYLLEGCIQQVVAPRINVAAARLFNRQGIEVVQSKTARCCGALALHMGRPDLARRQAREMITEIQGLGMDKFGYVTSTATGCQAVLKEYGELFRGEPEEQAAIQVAALAVDPSEIAQRFDRHSERHARFSVALHEPCSLRLMQRSATPYHETFAQAGLRVLSAPDSHMCCGSAGSYSLLQPVISKKLGRRRADQFDALGADVIVTANVGCLMQLDRYLDKRPLHILELLDWLDGGPEPPELAGWQDWQTTVDVPPTDTSSGVW